MAARNSSRMSTPAVHQTARTRRPTRWTLTEPAEPVPTSIRQGLVPRTIFFPSGWLERIEAKGPGALIEVLTLAIAAYGKGGAQ